MRSFFQFVWTLPCLKLFPGRWELMEEVRSFSEHVERFLNQKLCPNRKHTTNTSDTLNLTGWFVTYLSAFIHSHIRRSLVHLYHHHHYHYVN